MKHTLHALLFAGLTGVCGTAGAQTVSTFENVNLPGPDTTYLQTQVPNGDGVYTFQSGNALFYGNISWGYWGDFNCSNMTDTVLMVPGSNITGGGVHGSDKYGIAYVSIDFTNPENPTANIPVGAKLQGAAAGEHVLGTYVTNSVYAYRYILDGDYYADNHYFLKLIARGYLNGARTADSVSFTLADFTGANSLLVNTWEWMDLTALGKVDSITFDLFSNDMGAFGLNTPAYFAIDDLTTSDGVCPVARNIAAVSLNESSVTLNWEPGFTGFATAYEVAVDESATLAPAGAATTVTNGVYSQNDLSPNTLYYAHIRAACEDGGFSSWDTASFRTLAVNGIETSGGIAGLRISPNPATDVLHLGAQPLRAQVYSLEGRLLLQTAATRTLNVSRLPAGMYLLKVSTEDGRQTANLRFIKQN